MIAKRIENSLDKVSLKSLMLDKKKFQWREADGTVNNDGPTMLWLILSKINPSVRVGVSALKTNLQTANMAKFKHNVAEMLDYMLFQYNQIYEHNGSHEDFTLNLYSALNTANNAEFLKFVGNMKDSWETSDDAEEDRVTADILREKVLTKFNNMVQAKTWKRTEDPSAKVISALATQVQNLKDQMSQSSALATTAGNQNKPKLMIPQWRTEKKGERCDRDGKTWWWCPHHKKEGLFDGLYMPHKPCDHDTWVKEKKEKAEQRKRGKGTSNYSQKKPKLQLSDGMKQALVTQGKMTPEQATALWSNMMDSEN